MPINPSRMRSATAQGLILAVLLTRLPFVSSYLFEFDSISFAVATFRYDLSQVTPHMPGYILHILLARVVGWFVQDITLTFDWVSVLLSIGSVLYLWRAAAYLRGERVASIAAVLWLMLPIFWFYGCVPTVYAHEAFWSSAVLYYGLSLFRKPKEEWRAIALFVTLSLATAARQTSFLFFLPAIIYVLVQTKQSKRVWLMGIVWFCLVSALWMFELARESGGVGTYLHYAAAEHIFRSQSIFFGNSFTTHASTIGKVIFYLITGSFPLLLVIGSAGISFSKNFLDFARRYALHRFNIFLFLVAFPPIAFYLLIFFMKAGYLLNILPSLTLVTAVVLDQFVIWRVERIKHRPVNAMQLTRPLITRRVISSLAVVVLVDVLWFSLPLPGKEHIRFFESATRDSFSGEATGRFIHLSNDPIYSLLNRAFAYTSVQSIDAQDDISKYTLRALKRADALGNNSVIFDTWWMRWSYYYNPNAYVYDIRDYDDDSLAVGLSYHLVRSIPTDSVLHVPRSSRTMLFMRADHPDFPLLARQLQLQKIQDMPAYLDLFEVMDSSFTLRWKNKTFIR